MCDLLLAMVNSCGVDAGGVDTCCGGVVVGRGAFGFYHADMYGCDGESGLGVHGANR